MIITNFANRFTGNVSIIHTCIGRHFTGNHYDCTNTKANECATLGATTTTQAAASTQVGETGATSGATSFVDANRSIGTYLAANAPGVAQTNQAFIDQARQQRRNTWDARYSATPVVAYVKAGFKTKP